MIEIFILSIVQGITEFLPVSSSSHLILISKYFNFENQNLSLDVSLHIGSFFAVLFYFKYDIYNLLKNKDLFFKILISSVPVMIVGYILIQLNFINYLRNISIIGWTTLIFGLLLFIADKKSNTKYIKKDFDFKSAVFIGIFQIFSLIPGVSRSGITITAARILNFKRVEAAKISFLLSIPTLAGVSIFGINNLLTSENIEITSINLVSILLSFIFSFLTIKYFLKYIKKFSLLIFVLYRVVLGMVILFFANL